MDLIICLEYNLLGPKVPLNMLDGNVQNSWTNVDIARCFIKVNVYRRSLGVLITLAQRWHCMFGYKKSEARCSFSYIVVKLF